MNAFEVIGPAPLWRRFAAMAYDSVLIAAIWMVVAFVVLSLFGIEEARTIDGEAVVLDPLYKNTLFIAMLLSAFTFFAWFWSHSGQTLGMQAWKIKVQNPDGTAADLKSCLIRFVLAPVSLLFFGLGYITALFDTQRRTWHDKVSKTCIVRVKIDP